MYRSAGCTLNSHNGVCQSYLYKVGKRCLKSCSWKLFPMWVSDSLWYKHTVTERLREEREYMGPFLFPGKPQYRLKTTQPEAESTLDPGWRPIDNQLLLLGMDTTDSPDRGHRTLRLGLLCCMIWLWHSSNPLCLMHGYWPSVPVTCLESESGMWLLKFHVMSKCWTVWKYRFSSLWMEVSVPPIRLLMSGIPAHGKRGTSFGNRHWEPGMEKNDKFPHLEPWSETRTWSGHCRHSSLLGWGVTHK